MPLCQEEGGSGDHKVEGRSGAGIQVGDLTFGDKEAEELRRLEELNPGSTRTIGNKLLTQNDYLLPSSVYIRGRKSIHKFYDFLMNHKSKKAEVNGHASC